MPSPFKFALLLATAPALSAITINPIYGPNVPAQAQAAFNAIAATYAASFTNPGAINVELDWGSTGLGSSATPIGFLSYSDWRSLLQFDAVFSPQNPYLYAAANSLPASNPLPGNGNVSLTFADALALGILIPDITDGFITINGNEPFEYNGVAEPNTFDFTAVAEHELDEILGINSALTGIANNGPLPSDPNSGTCADPTAPLPNQICYTAEDYFRFDSSGAHEITTDPNAAVFFSYNGTSDVAQFNQDNNAAGASGADRNDWVYGNFGCPAATPLIQNAIACPGQAPAFSLNSPEAVTLETLGYDAAPEPSAWLLFVLAAAALFARRTVLCARRAALLR
jgi:hypothetical protein